MKIVESIKKALEHISGATCEISESFYIPDTPYLNDNGLMTYPDKQISGITVTLVDYSDPDYVWGRTLKTIAFDLDGNHYRRIGSCDAGVSLYEATPKDGYDGFEWLEIVELVRLRDYIISKL